MNADRPGLQARQSTNSLRCLVVEWPIGYFSIHSGPLRYPTSPSLLPSSTCQPRSRTSSPPAREAAFCPSSASTSPQQHVGRLRRYNVCARWKGCRATRSEKEPFSVSWRRTLLGSVMDTTWDVSISVYHRYVCLGTKTFGSGHSAKGLRDVLWPDRGHPADSRNYRGYLNSSSDKSGSHYHADSN